MLIELTSAYTGEPLALAVELIGEVKARRLGEGLGRTMLIHARNRRVHWEVTEDYGEVMRRIREADRRGGGVGAVPPAVEPRRVARVHRAHGPGDAGSGEGGLVPALGGTIGLGDW